MGIAICLLVVVFRGEIPDVRVDTKTNVVSRHDASGRLLWSVRMGGYLHLVRPPHSQWDKERVYISHDDGVTALDMKTGKMVWHSKGPYERLLLSGDLLLAADCDSGGPNTTNGRWLTARATRTGAEVFKIRLPTEESFLQHIREITGLFLVQICDLPGGKGYAIPFNRQGQTFYRHTCEIVDGRMHGENRILISSRDVVCLAPDGKTRWTTAFERREFCAGGGLVSIPGGDLVAFLYGSIGDTGVHVMRLDPSQGKVAWRGYCEGLGVAHSIYSHHAYVTVEDGQIRVNSQGSSGNFVEQLDIETGRQLKRTRPKK